MSDRRLPPASGGDQLEVAGNAFPRSNPPPAAADQRRDRQLAVCSLRPYGDDFLTVGVLDHQRHCALALGSVAQIID